MYPTLTVCVKYIAQHWFRCHSISSSFCTFIIRYEWCIVWVKWNNYFNSVQKYFSAIYGTTYFFLIHLHVLAFDPQNMRNKKMVHRNYLEKNLAKNSRRLGKFIRCHTFIPLLFSSLFSFFFRSHIHWLDFCSGIFILNLLWYESKISFLRDDPFSFSKYEKGLSIKEQKKPGIKECEKSFNTSVVAFFKAHEWKYLATIYHRST